jgi:spore coat polysaccharide biosynthesis protein SpsF
MRVTSDCPLIDPVICSNLLRLREESAADYACNNMPRTFPHGLDCEAFSVAALREAAAFSTEAADREHVTPWLRRAEHLRRVNLSSHQAGISHHRWTLDYPEDFAFLEALYSVIPSESEPCMNDVLAVLDSNPEISRINRARSAGETEPASTSAPGRRS